MDPGRWFVTSIISVVALVTTAAPAWAVEPSPSASVEEASSLASDDGLGKEGATVPSDSPLGGGAQGDLIGESSLPQIAPVRSTPVVPPAPADNDVLDAPDLPAELIAPEPGVELLEVVDESTFEDLIAERANAEFAQGDSIVVGAALATLSELAQSVYGDPGIVATALTARPDLVAADLPRMEAGDNLSVEVLPQLFDGSIPGASFAARIESGFSSGTQWVELAFDASGFLDAMGADYADRITFVALPECVLVRPSDPECVVGVPLEARRDGEGILRVYAPANAMSLGDISGRFSAPFSTGGGGGTIIAAVTGADSQSGTFRTTDLAPRGTWGLTEPTGSFTYGIPIATPPVQAGPVPDVSLSYSSQSTDGKTFAANSQASVVGEGWTMPTSFIERLYKPCTDDGGTTPELCWASPYSNAKNEAAYVLSLGGTTHELVWRSTDTGASAATYVAASDPTLKVTRYYGAAGRAGNGDDDGEYFEVKTPDGSVYYFGFNPTTASGLTNSIAWQPVYYNSTGEGTYAGTNVLIANQAYRFMLDLVVDVHDNAATYFYGTDENKYTNSTTKDYVRDIRLERVEYGQRYESGTTSVTAADAKVEFDMVLRCVERGQFVDTLRADPQGLEDCPPLELPNFRSYPDVPLDLICSADPCNSAQNAPVYFSSVRLNAINTFARDGVNYGVDDWVPVETTQFIHAYPTTADGSARSLWLDSVYTRGWGTTASGDEVDTYLTKFSGIRLNNRVDWDLTVTANEVPQRALDRMRISSVWTDMGGRVDVTYAAADDGVTHPGGLEAAMCPQEGKDGANYSAWATAEPLGTINSADNDQLCYAVKRGSELQIFHNYVVTAVTMVDTVADTPDQEHTYTYGGAPAYGRADSLLYAIGSTGDTSTFSSYRGFQIISSTMGDGTQAPTTTNQYYRGTGQLTWSLQEQQVYDNIRLQGRLLASQVTYPEGVSGYVATSTRYHYTETPIGSTPSWVRTDVSLQHNPHVVHAEWIVSTEYDGDWSRTTETEYDFDPDLHVPVNVLTMVGTQIATVHDEFEARCESTEYLSSESPYMVVPWRTESREGNCTTGIVTGASEVGYDGYDWDDPLEPPQVLTRGLVTSERTYTDESTVTTAEAAYDTLGRIESAWMPSDVGSSTPTVAWDYGTDGALWTTEVTRALGQVSKTWSERGHGTTVKSKGATDGDWTHYQYDALGLLVAGWAPAQWGGSTTPDLAADTPTSLFVYDVYADGPTVRSTPVVVASAPFVTDDGTDYEGHDLSGTTRRSYTFLDGWGRTLEQHAVAPDGTGRRTVTATGYNHLGQVAWTSAPFVAEGAARFLNQDGTTALVNAQPDDISLTTRVTYDTLGRQVSTEQVACPEDPQEPCVSHAGGTTEYEGPVTTATAPDGSQVSSTVDVLGRIVEQRAIAAGETDQVTTYEYETLTSAGQVGFQRVTVTDPELHDTVFVSDLAGRKVELVDPNSGASTYTYDADGRVVSVASNTGVTTMAYDALGRMIERTTKDPANVDSSSAAWDYVDPGETGDATDLGLLRSESSTTETSEGPLTTVTDHDYNPDHQVVKTSVTLPNDPILGDLAGEDYETTYEYDALGQPTVTGFPEAGGLPEEFAITGRRLNGSPQTLTLESENAQQEQLSTALVTGVTFDAVGQLVSRSYGNGVDRTYGWDARRQLESLSAVFDHDGPGGSPAVAVQHDTFTRDVMGRIVRSQNLVPDAATDTVTAECFDYNGFNRLEAAWTVGGETLPGACGTVAPASSADPVWDDTDTVYASQWEYTPAGRIESHIRGVDGVSVTSDLEYLDTDTDGSGPDGVSPAAVTSVETVTAEHEVTVSDGFTTGDYAGDDTSARWVGWWLESDDTGTPQHTTGLIDVVSGELRLTAALPADPVPTLTRTIDTTGIVDGDLQLTLTEWSDSTLADDRLLIAVFADGNPTPVTAAFAGGDGLPAGTGGTPDTVTMDISGLLPADEVTVHLSVTSTVDEQLTPAPVFLIDTVAVVLTVDETTTTDSFTYDAAGRMLTRDVNGTETALTWDASSNLTSTTADGVVTIYAYDAGGQRVAQATLAAGSDPGTASAYVAGMELTDPDTGSTSTGDVTGTRFYTFGGATVAVRTAQGLSLLLGDEQGSAQIMMPLHTDSNGALLPATQADADNTQRTAYAPYGARRGEDLEDINRGWLGQVEDGGTGLTYLNARYYDPAIGRFLSPDPLMDISNPKTLDPYMYAANNPVTFMDATGLCYGLDAKQMAACATASTTSHGLLAKSVQTANARLNGAARGTSHMIRPPGTSDQFLTIPIQVVPGAGQVLVGAFISTEMAGLPGARSAGDNRTFDYRRTWDESRFSALIDFETGLATLRTSNSCKDAAHLRCVSATPGGVSAESLPFASTTAYGANYCLWGPSSCFAPSSLDGAEAVVIDFAKKNPAVSLPYVPELNLQITVAPSTTGEMFISVTGDVYPSVEAYRIGTDATATTMIQSQQYLAGLGPSWLREAGAVSLQGPNSSRGVAFG